MDLGKQQNSIYIEKNWIIRFGEWQPCVFFGVGFNFFRHIILRPPNMIELLRSFTSPIQTWSYDSHNLCSIYWRNTGFTVTWESIWNLIFTFWTLAFTSSMIVKDNILILHPRNMLEFTYTFCCSFKTVSNFLAIKIRIK